MMEEAPQSLLILVDPDQFGEHPLVEMVPVPRSEVAESAIFQPRPYLFHRVELRRVRRKQFQAQTPMVGPQQIPDRIPFMHVPAIPNDDDRTPHGLEQSLQEEGDILVIEIPV